MQNLIGSPPAGVLDFPHSPHQPTHERPPAPEFESRRDNRPNVGAVGGVRKFAVPSVELTSKGIAYCLRHGREAAERRIERHLALVTALIQTLDVMDGEPDLEDSDPSGGDINDEPHDATDEGNDEPSLGWTDKEGQRGCWPVFVADLEQEHDGREPDEDREPSIGFDALEGGDVQDEPHDPEVDGCMADEMPDHFGERQSNRRAGRALLAKLPCHRDRRLPIGTDVAKLPVRYTMQCEGTCLEPFVKDGSRLEFSSVERPRPGDYVAIFRRPASVKPGDWQVVVKKLVLRIPPGSEVTLPGRGLGVLVEMHNPPRRLFYREEDVEAVHKMVGVHPASERRL